MGAAIEHKNDGAWVGYIEDGMITYDVIELKYNTLTALKQRIKAFYGRRRERDLFNRRMIGENV